MRAPAVFALLAVLSMVSCHSEQTPSQFAGLGALAASAEGFAQADPQRPLRFPEDHGAHPDYRVEWWYLTANLADSQGRPYGVQWTVFRSALHPTDTPTANPWQDPQVYMAHFAVTTPDEHRAFQRYARGGEHQGLARAGARALPFEVWLDDWSLTQQIGGAVDPQAQTRAKPPGKQLGPLLLTARQDGVSATLSLHTEMPMVLQGEQGFSQKHPNGGGSHYYSQPFYSAEGELLIDGQQLAVTGQAWLDREWSSQFLQPDQAGWDWFALHLDSGEKLMLFQLRNTNADQPAFKHAVLIDERGSQTPLQTELMTLSPVRHTTVAARQIPTRWHIDLPEIDRQLTVEALHPQQWLNVDFAYWEGYVLATGASPGESGRGYLEMVGY